MAASSLPNEKTEQLLEERKQWPDFTNEKSAAEDEYDSDISEEMELNRHLSTFIKNVIAAYRRHSGETRKHDDDVALCKDVELPSGTEFKQLVRWFMKEGDTTVENKYQLAGILLEQLRISQHTNEKDRLNQEELDVMCLQILRAFVQNEINKLPADWKDTSLICNSQVADQLSAVRRVQDALNKHECAPKVLRHLSKTSSEIVIKEILAFLIVMLFNNNESTQASITEYIIHNGTFIDSLKIRMYRAIIVTKKRWSSITQQNALAEEKKRRRAMIEAHKISESASEGESADGRRSRRGFELRPLLKRNNAVHPYTEPQTQELNQLPSETNEEDCTELLISMLGLMCEGQNRKMQDILRVQPADKSVNLIAETSNLLRVIYNNLYPETIRLAITLFNALSHFCSGNYENAIIVAENNICGFINCILMTDLFQDCSPEDITELKMSMARLIATFLHEATVGRQLDGSTHASLTEVVRGFDVDSILQEAEGMYEKIKNGARTSVNLQPVRNLGFNFFFILRHIWDMDQSFISQTELLKYPLRQEAFQFYQTRTKSIEIVERNVTQKVYFSYSGKIEIDENMKESLRDAMGKPYYSKLSHFAHWLEDTVDLVKKQKRNTIWQNFVWKLLNATMTFLTFIHVVWMFESNSSYKFEIVVKPNSYFPFFLLHNVITLAVFVLYFVRNRFIFPSLKSLRLENNKARDEQKKRRSKLAVPFFGFETLWYFMLLVFSILGTLSGGFFFAFHLLHVVTYNRRVMNCLRFFTRRGFWPMLIFGVLFVVICIYICVLFKFVFFHEVKPECDSFLDCFTALLLNTNILCDQDPDTTNYGYEAWKTVLIVLTAIGFCFLVGFCAGQYTRYQEKERRITQNRRHRCFICGLSRNDMKKSGTDFDRHIEKEHSLWSYVYYYIYLAEMSKQYYTPVDYYVSRMLQKGSLEFLPLHKVTSEE